jgi:hypothetical protein
VRFTARDGISLVINGRPQPTPATFGSSLVTA